MSDFYALVFVLLFVWALAGLVFVVLVAKSNIDLDRLDRAARIWRSLRQPRTVLIRRRKR